jgi:hypothetical protein
MRPSFHPVLDRKSFHCQKNRNGADGNFDTIASSIRHLRLNGNELVELCRQLGSIRSLDPKVVYELRLVLLDVGRGWHQKVDTNIDVVSAVSSGNHTPELEVFLPCF